MEAKVRIGLQGSLRRRDVFVCLFVNPGEVARGIFRPHKNLYFSSWPISWNHNQTVHIPFATSLPFC